MSKIELAMELDRANGAYEPGEPIEGCVVVRTTEPGSSRRLVVSLGVVARPLPPVEHARTEVGLLEQSVLAENVDWRAGDVRRFPFRLTTTGLVRSYAGQLMRLQPCVHVATAVSRSEVREIEIAPRRDRGLHVAWSASDLAPRRILWLPLSAVLLVASTASTGWAFADGIAPLLFVALLVALGSAVAFAFGVRPWLSQLRTGAIRIALEQGPGPSGALADGSRALRVTLEVPAAKPLASPPRARLVVRELVRRYTSGATPSWTRDLFSEAVELRAGGAPGRMQGDVALPDAGSVPYNLTIGSLDGASDGGAGFAIEWWLEIEVPAGPGADFRRRIPLRARPIDVPFDVERG